MAWEGKKLKALTKDKGISLTGLAELLNVSRQTINDWIKGQVPKGSHLMSISKVLDVSPSFFFPKEVSANISMPLHRKRGVAKITGAMKQEAERIAKQYEKLFKWAPDPGLVPVLRVDHRDRKNAITMAIRLRKLTGIETDKPMDYERAFHLLTSLGISAIFRYFPNDIKGYAFYCKIHKHRVVFVNNDTNVLDLIFPLLHETIHAIRDEEGSVPGDPDEEKFCDMVANLIQFPDAYVKLVYNTIKGRRKPIQINLLKNFSAENSHSIFGIIEQLKELNPSLDLQVRGANTNLKKQFPSIGDILFKDKDPGEYIHALDALSPLFLDIVARNIAKVTTRKAGEWLGLESQLDAELAIRELQKINTGVAS
ncbi:MAG: helix-turn-helix transcriptional regulator [Deltaproteobacteria bacterium]|nr:helix-turn-helix transcriptional regulator [Deltaproteobacteria bacterium]